MGFLLAVQNAHNISLLGAHLLVMLGKRSSNGMSWTKSWYIMLVTFSNMQLHEGGGVLNKLKLTIIYYGLLWILWKARNETLFEGDFITPSRGVYNIKCLVFLWLKCTDKGDICNRRSVIPLSYPLYNSLSFCSRFALV